MQNPFPFWPVAGFRRYRYYFFFHHALQGMLVLAREIHHLRHLGLGDLVGKYTALANPVMMDVKHAIGWSAASTSFLEELLQDVNDASHRRIVVVQDQKPDKGSAVWSSV